MLFRSLLETGEDSGIPFSDTVLLLETDMDHISGEVMGDVASRLLEADALDVSWTSLYMKKGRPGYRLSVLATDEKGKTLVDLIMRHTRTLGVRVQKIQRVTADRRALTVELDGETVEAKECTCNGVTFTKPEYESLAAMARKRGVSVIDMMEAFVRRSGE